MRHAIKRNAINVFNVDPSNTRIASSERIELSPNRHQAAWLFTRRLGLAAASSSSRYSAVR